MKCKINFCLQGFAKTTLC